MQDETLSNLDMSWLLISGYALVLCLLPTECRCNVLNRPIVGIEMGEAGFHRDLVYTVQFDYPLAGKECEYILEQPLPAAVYVSVDQLDDLNRRRKLDAIFPNFVDVEKQTEHSEPFTVMLKGTPKITDTIKLPINFRYHAPNADKSFEPVNIGMPRMYLNCPYNDVDLIGKELQPIPSVKYCLYVETQSFSVHTPAENTLELIENCNWNLINADYQLKSALVAEIPVGNEKGFPPLLYVTILLSWVVSLFTAYRTHHVPRRINYKLEEQRILQNKIK